MNTYKWSIKQLDYAVEQNGKSDVVTNIHWGVVATNDQIEKSTETAPNLYSSSNQGIATIDLNESENFTDYSNLTEAQVLQWLMAKLGGSSIVAIKNSLDSQIASQVNPPVKSGIPWAQD
jgi:hypothetical protein